MILREKENSLIVVKKYQIATLIRPKINQYFWWNYTKWSLTNVYIQEKLIIDVYYNLFTKVIIVVLVDLHLHEPLVTAVAK